uniref:Uncharacterized protein n=1 Tax=Gossypium raimondii TaxID=29730 RepID=A0A0D2QJN9_GOSRA|nr:hypothetical protein B456_003G124200 [Gossypium raimondii]
MVWATSSSRADKAALWPNSLRVELTQNPVLPLPSLDSLLQHHSTTIINPHRSSVNLILPLSQHQNHHTQLP